MPPDGLAVEDQGRDRFLELPHELPSVAGFAFIDLSALWINFEDFGALGGGWQIREDSYFVTAATI